MKKAHVLTSSLMFLVPSLMLASVSLEISPGTFDFGWCPDNAEVTCDFRVRNVSEMLIPLTSVEPSCGCTAADFTPEELASSEETSIRLTFNTRGYKNARFNKMTRVKAGVEEQEYQIRLRGVVAQDEVAVRPVGTGVAEFPPNNRKRRRVIKIQNKTDSSVPLEVVRPPDSWAKVSFNKSVIPAGGTVKMEVRVQGSLDEKRATSVTVEALEGSHPHRFTVAIRTGPPPAPYKPRIRPPTPFKKTSDK